MAARGIRCALVTLGLAVLSCGADDEEQSEVFVPDVGARGVSVSQVAIYQGLKRTLMLDGAPQPDGVPLVAGRDALLRIYYDTGGEYDGEPVTGRLHLPGHEPLEATAVLATSSVEEDLATTVNIPVPGSFIGRSLDYRLALAQPEAESREDNPAARFPQDRSVASVPVEGPRNTLRIIIAPFAYEADGSGRVPNTSPEQIESIRQRFLGMYPVSDVEITVREPQPWTTHIDPSGESGWATVGIELLSYREEDGAGDDVYYYGIFNPAETFEEYCGSRCVLGMTLLNDTPPETGTVMLRIAIGVGFDSRAANTAIHEIGHAHGLRHAPCGVGLDPESLDPDYPYADGTIGVWAYDPLLGELLDPTVYTDMMSYCEVNWTSDYHYRKLLTRSANVNLSDWHPPPGGAIEYQLVTLDGRGHGELQIVTSYQRPLAGTPTPVVARSGKRTQSVDGRYLPYDHRPGGWLFVPTGGERLDRIEVRMDGQTIVVER
jgi:hypothetical protein